MDKWLTVLISVLVFQGLVSLLGLTSAYRNEPKKHFIKRFFGFIFFILVSPILNLLYLLGFWKLVKRVERYEEFIQIVED